MDKIPSELREKLRGIADQVEIDWLQDSHGQGRINKRVEAAILAAVPLISEHQMRRDMGVCRQEELQLLHQESQNGEPVLLQMAGVAKCCAQKIERAFKEAGK